MPAPPTLVSLTPDIRSITVKFSPPSPSNGVVIAYDVAYSVKLDFTDGLQKTSTSITTILTALSPATVYYVKVRRCLLQEMGISPF